MPAPQFMVAILAGGAATRLDGRDKGLEPLLGRPLVAWVVDAVREMEMSFKRSLAGEITCTPADGARDAEADFASPSPSESSSLLIVANRHLDVYARHARTVADSIPGFRGPLAGIATALAHCTAPLLLTVPVDCPDPPRDLALRFLDGMHTGDADAFVAHDGEQRQPLFALYRRALATSALAAVGAGQGVWAWQTSIAARELDFADCRSHFQNLNNREQFAAYVAEHRFDA